MLKLMFPGITRNVGLMTAVADIATLIGELVTKLHNTRAHAASTHTHVAVPKTVTDHFKIYFTACLLELMGAMRQQFHSQNEPPLIQNTN